MKTTPRSCVVFRSLQRGAVAVEFALVSALFLLMLLLGIIELGRAFFYMNASAQATRLGARMAVVCDKSQDLLIKQRMQEYVGVLRATDIGVEYSVDGDVFGTDTCTADGPTTCRFVRVRILPGATFQTFIPFVPLPPWTIPSFATTLPRESMSSADNTNPVCKPPWAESPWIPL